jgi:TonB family protein
LAIAFGARTIERGATETPPHIIFNPVHDPVPQAHLPPRTGVRCDVCAPSHPMLIEHTIEFPVTIPTTIPPIGSEILIGPSGGNPAPSDSGGGEFSPTVDVPARPMPGNPQPVYPSFLRSSHVEGVIAAHFVVDSTGHVEPRSITFESGSNALFESAVRRALLASRYEPARANGSAVAMRVEQEFAFRITP